MTRPGASGHIRHARERGTLASSSDRVGGAGFAGRTAVGPRIRVHGNDPQERTCAHCPSGRGAARSPRRRRRDRDAGRSPDRPGAPGRRRRRGLRCSCGTRDARAMAGQRGPAMARGAAPVIGRARARAPAQPRGGSDRRRSCGRCGSRAGRGHRRARERCRARACRRVRRAPLGGVGAGRAWRSAGERSFGVCIVRATGLAPHVAAGGPDAAGWAGDEPSSHVDVGSRVARHGAA